MLGYPSLAVVEDLGSDGAKSYCFSVAYHLTLASHHLVISGVNINKPSCL